KDLLRIANQQQKEFSFIFEKILVPELKKVGIEIVSWKNLNKEQVEFVDTYFKESLLPFVQPVLLVGKKIKPFLNNGALYLALHLQSNDSDIAKSVPEYAIVKIPSDHLSRFLELPSKHPDIKQILMLDDVVRYS